MARRITDDYLDDIPSLDFNTAFNDADEAFWDEFLMLESQAEAREDTYTITITNEVTGDKKTIRHVRFKKN